MEEQRFFAAVIEQERVAALQSRHHLAFARLLGNQEADGVLRARVGGPAADVDSLGLRRRVVQHVGVHAVVVDDDLGLLQALVAPQRNQVRRARSRANQINDGSHGGILAGLGGLEA